jgi:hypothetical protein
MRLPGDSVLAAVIGAKSAASSFALHQLTRWWWILGQAFDRRRQGAVPLEGDPTDGHLVDHYPEGVDVRRRCDLTTFDLFRRHIGRGSHHRTGHGESAAGSSGLLTAPRQPKVGDHRPGTGVHGFEDDVGRLEIPVHHAGCMGGVEGRGHLFDEWQRLSRGHRPGAI